jgi:ATP-dependent RNA helicase RhlE
MIDISLEGFVTFASFGLPTPILKGVRAAGLTEPTAIQSKSIPIIMQGNDLIGIAQGGSGKSGAYLLPILGRLTERSSRLRGIVLVPTRELASYVETRARDYARFTETSIGVVYTGSPISAQEKMLRERPINLLVATPGRLLELHARGCLNFADVEILVLDEADRMVALGLAPDLRKLLKLLPETRQTLLFTLTMPPELNRLAKEALVEPVRVDVGPATKPAAAGITQAIYPVNRDLKPDLLDDLLARSEVRNTIVLTRARAGGERVTRQLTRRGYAVALLDEHPSQGDREQSLEDLRRGRVQILVASDTSARSLDMAGTAHIVNFDVPQTPEDYVHRLGRAGRGDPVGDAFTLMSPEEQKHVDAIERFLGRAIPRVMLPDFDYAMTPGSHRPTALDEETPAERTAGVAAAAERIARGPKPAAANGGAVATAPRPASPPAPSRPAASRPAARRPAQRSHAVKGSHSTNGKTTHSRPATTRVRNAKRTARPTTRPAAKATRSRPRSK